MKDPPSVGGQYQCRCKDCDRVIGQSEVVCGKMTNISTEMKDIRTLLFIGKNYYVLIQFQSQ